MHRLIEHPGRFTISRLSQDEAQPAWVPTTGFTSVTRTRSELTVVCDSTAVPDAVWAEPGWTLFEVEGPLPLDATGIISSVVAPLSSAGVPVFTVASYDTDWILIPAEQARSAIAVWRAAGFDLVNQVP